MISKTLLIFTAMSFSGSMGIVLQNVVVKDTLNYTMRELTQQKKECEEVIPRSQVCEASIIFLPTAIEE